MRALTGIITALAFYLLLSLTLWFTYPDSVTRTSVQSLMGFIAAAGVAGLAITLSVKIGRPFALGLGATLLILGVLANLLPPPGTYGDLVFDWHYVILVGGRSFVAVATGAAVIAVALARNTVPGHATHRG
ncbi:hypothetical protein [Microbacterium oleivorans]|uniref:Uncharacterized protein n=1 Tax=Microbacterium oleivorans TaxID=273677 RepID=A0A7D5ISN7_9MICO|nr:hypothetical protein [Microbacterium oleivorans]QLD11474.1 hypothetical protein HW566_06625 [Microbacterium oleivorans]